jgi:hypothetical protein
MNYKLEILSIVYEDIKEISVWYDHQKTGLGTSFRKSLYSQLEKIKKSPLGYQEKYKQIRQSLVDKYPYNINFKVFEIENKIVVYGVTHTSRDPNLWEKRI